jgi:hypothetical protein
MRIVVTRIEMINNTVLCGEMLKYINLNKLVFNMANMVYMYGIIISIHISISNAKYQVL